MRKIAVVAILAIVAAMVPASIASSQPTPGSLDGVGTVMFVNAYPGFAVDVWIKIEGSFQKFSLSTPGQEEVQIPAADHSYQVCASPSDDETCAGGPGALGAPGVMHIESNDILNGLIDPFAGPTALDLQENSTDPTETDHAQLTIFNAIPAPVDICVDGKHVISLPSAGAPPLPTQLAEFDSKDGEGQQFLIYIGTFAVSGGVCNAASVPPPDANRDQGFPSGSNTVINLTTNPSCTSDCGYQIFPGEEPPSTSQQVDAFCAVVLDAANITPWLQALFDEVEVGNEDTYPSSDKVEKVITRVAELLEKGNQTAPKDIREVWLRATASFVETGRLAAVQYDIAALPQDDLRRLIDGVEHPGADDSEEAADTAALTAWVTTNCFHAVTAEPSFTG